MINASWFWLFIKVCYVLFLIFFSKAENNILKKVSWPTYFDIIFCFCLKQGQSGPQSNKLTRSRLTILLFFFVFILSVFVLHLFCFLLSLFFNFEFNLAFLCFMLLSLFSFCFDLRVASLSRFCDLLRHLFFQFSLNLSVSCLIVFCKISVLKNFARYSGKTIYDATISQKAAE